VLRLARRAGAQAVVLECMALDPVLQDVSERDIVRATIGVITNVRRDHTEVMGRSVEAIAETLANTIPAHAVLVHGETRCASILEARAARVGTRVVRATPPGAVESWDWIEEARAIALAVCAHLGIREEVARRGMTRAPLDPGAFRAGTVAGASGEVRWMDASAANDPDSLNRLVAASVSAPGCAPGASSPTAPDLVVYNHRSDRGPRLADFATHDSMLAATGRLVITGERPALTLSRRLARIRAGRTIEFVPPCRLSKWLKDNVRVGTVVFCGNTRGLKVTTVLEEMASRG
jgi:poly-gamma-glutamate synthase PgsB/CapB